MKKVEAKELMMKHLMPCIEKYGYKEKKSSSSDFEIFRKTSSGRDVIGGGVNDYNPIQKIIYGTGKINDRVNKILFSLQDTGIFLSPPVRKDSRLISTSYPATHNLDYYDYLPEMLTESDVEKCVEMMLEFLEGTAFPLLEKFEDLREIDKIINGEAPWETDWGKPFILGAYFNFTRLIIAKLSGNNKYNWLIDFTYSVLEKRSKENGHSFIYDRNDLTKPLPALIKLLEGIEPIF